MTHAEMSEYYRHPVGHEPHGGMPSHPYGYGREPYGMNLAGHSWPGGGGGHEYGAPGAGLPHAMQQLLWSEDFAEAVLRVCRDKMDATLATQGYYPAGMQGAGYGARGDAEYARHRAFKKVLDELRDAPSGEVARRVEARFTGLTPEERKLVIVEAGESSHAKLAAKAGISVERMFELNRSLEEKLKMQD